MACKRPKVFMRFSWVSQWHNGETCLIHQCHLLKPNQRQFQHTPNEHVTQIQHAMLGLLVEHEVPATLPLYDY